MFLHTRRIYLVSDSSVCTAGKIIKYKKYTLMLQIL